MQTKAEWDELKRRVAALEARLEDPGTDLPPNAEGVLHTVLRVLRRGGKWKPADRTDALTRGSSFDRIMSDLRTETALERDQKRTPPGERN